ncbi:hypothetical protein [Phenylobacterium kunshanense]|uniref:Uncharacterized protein n=1 Tax=Phenylobacterium kunshanense TaxID=1445034 RepID=A0A328BGW6_9CAUL|nr:hypothetical protein [Phenylobacterium kunshanense]RAK64398.1 hypothetical protein DJ019_14640 [Phenylobacterium kunshanense]
MAKPPPEDDQRITDLNRYRKAKEAERKRPPPKPPRPREGLLGSNPKAGLILAIAVIVLLALFVVPMFLR